MKICKDGRAWGQNNKEAGDHLGILSRREKYTGKGVKGVNNPMYGRYHSAGALEFFRNRRHSAETRRKMSEAKMGAKHPNWKGGISGESILLRMRLEYKLWHEAVLARDDWTCHICGKRGGKLYPHHIKSFAQFPELRYAVDNGVTLCAGCHKLTKNYGRKAIH